MKTDYDFSGILLASDWDGTLSVEGTVSEKNCRAIEEFQRGGGYFTVVSGRTPSYLSERFAGFSPNTYTVGLNGAMIEDLRTGETLYHGFCDAGMLKPLHAVLQAAAGILQVTLYTEDTTYVFSPEELVRFLPELIPEKVYKTVFLTKSASDAEGLLTLARSVPHRGYEIVRSFATGVELLSEKSGKGAALSRLKEKLGVRYALAVGDFENDISLLRAADIGYAVEDAAPTLLAVADRVICPARDGAIAAVLSDIKKRGI